MYILCHSGSQLGFLRSLFAEISFCLYIEAKVGNFPRDVDFENEVHLLQSELHYHDAYLWCYPSGLWGIFSVVVWLVVYMNHGKHSGAIRLNQFCLGWSSWCLLKSIKQSLEPHTTCGLKRPCLSVSWMLWDHRPAHFILISVVLTLRVNSVSHWWLILPHLWRRTVSGQYFKNLRRFLKI